MILLSLAFSEEADEWNFADLQASCPVEQEISLLNNYAVITV